jgi:Flp pilus assembly CpaF family ATPase
MLRAVEGSNRMDKQGQRETLMALFRQSLGHQVVALMDDERVTDVVINPDERVFVKRGGQWEDAGFTRPAAQTHTAVVTAGTLKRVVVDEERPYLGVRVPGFGWRMQAVVEPVVVNSTIVLRRPASEIFTLEQYFEDGRVSARQLQAICEAIDTGKNVVVVGATGSGKTTFLNACGDRIRKTCPTDRVLLLEDTEELQCNVANCTTMLIRPPHTMAEAVRETLRMIPTRIIIGELRGGAETAALLRAWSTGHGGGMTSLHAGSARGALLQLEDYVADVPGAGLRRTQIAKVVNLIVYAENYCVEQVLRVHGELDEANNFLCEEIAK